MAMDQDSHDSVNEGESWASPSFNPVQATGVAIRFDNPAGATTPFVHCKLHEFQVMQSGCAFISDDRFESGDLAKWLVVE